MATKHRLILAQPKRNAAPVKSNRHEMSPEDLARRNHLIRLYITAIVLLSMMFTVYVWQSTKMIEIKLRNNRLERQIESINNNNADLRSEIVKLHSLSRIEKIAKEELGLIFPEQQIFITLPNDWKEK